MDQIQIEIYQEPSGKQPFLNWENGLSREVRAIVTARLTRVRLGNLGDCKSFEGINVRINYGPGYRIYFGKKGRTIVILLCGGDKSTQKKDIKKARFSGRITRQKQRGDKK